MTGDIYPLFLRRVCGIVFTMWLLAGWTGVSLAAPTLSVGNSWQTELDHSNRTLTYSLDTTGGYLIENGLLSESLDEQFPQIPQWRDALRQVLENWGEPADITFVEVEDSGDSHGAAGAQGLIRFFAYPILEAATAWAKAPVLTGYTEEDLGSSHWGDIAFNTGITPEWDVQTFMGETSHELGHALGLAGHNLNPESVMYGLGGSHASAPGEQDLADIRAFYFPQNSPAELLQEPEISGERDWFAVADGTSETKVQVVVTGSGRIVTTGEQKTGIKGVGISLADENYGFDHVDLRMEEGGRIETDGHNAYGIGAGDFNTIDIEGYISTAGYSADGLALLGRGNTLRTGASSLIRTFGDSGNGLFVGGELDDSGFHGNSVIADGRIETSGSGGCGIYAGGNSDLTLNGSIVTSGKSAMGIGADQFGYLNILVDQAATIQTSGNQAYGILLRGAGNRITMNGAITTSAAKAYGIFTFWGEDNEIISSGSITTQGDSAYGIYSHGYGSSVILDGIIRTSGVGAFGILAHEANQSVISEGEIVTSGNGAIGLGGSGSGHRLKNRGTIRTLGIQAHGLAAANLNNHLTNYGTVTTSGGQARGFYAWGTGNQMENLGLIITTGSSGYGMHIFGTGNQAENSGQISTKGTSGYGLFLADRGNRALNNGDIFTGGNFAHGLVADGGENLLVHSGRIETAGEDAFGIFVRGGDNGLEIAGAVVSGQAEAVRLGGLWNSGATGVEPTDATGNRLLLHGSPEIVGDIVNDGADEGATVYFGAAIDETVPDLYVPAPTDFAYGGSFTGRTWRGEAVSGIVRLNGERNAFSLLTVHSGALLGGNTTLTGDLMNNGRVAPGNSIGTIAVEGDYLQAAGADLQMEIGGAESDRLTVGGDAIFEEGALLSIEPITPILGGSFSLLEAGGMLGGMPQMNVGDTALLGFTLENVNEALTLQVARTAYADIAASGNQRHLGAALDRLLRDASGDLAAILLQVDGLVEAAAVRQTFDALTPTSYAALPDAAFFSMRRFIAALPSTETAQLNTGAPWSGFVRGLSLHARRDDGSGMTGYRHDAEGIVFGGDRRLGDLQVGGALSFQRMEVDHDNSHSQTKSEALLAALRTSWRRDRWHLLGLVGYGHQWDGSRREIRAADFSRLAKSSGQADTLFAAVESGHSFRTGPVTLTPFGGLDYAAYFWGGFAEKGAGSLNASIESTSAESLRGTMGVVIAAPTDVGGVTLDPRVRLAWSHEFADDSYAYRAQLAGESFRVHGRDLGRDYLEAGLNLQVRFGQKISFGVRLDYQRRHDQEGYAAEGGITWQF